MSEWCPRCGSRIFDDPRDNCGHVTAQVETENERLREAVREAHGELQDLASKFRGKGKFDDALSILGIGSILHAALSDQEEAGRR